MKPRMMLFLLVAIGACDNGPAEDSETVLGHYIWGAEVNVFTPCGVEHAFWLDGSPSMIEEMRERYMEFGLAPYSEVFVEVRGEVGPRLDCGFCEEYEGSFRVDELVRMESQATATCPA